ncbi:NUDIX domain-containing protein [Phenylobacterium sp.]|uniref:NUDIX hydrolase n=2 Tax=Phenylobacterium sp. TaxID=1871053 RepID=UPI0026013C2D|nr:NUDIX domain-containing protein [Phenylobacterium sp.]
MTVSPSPDLDHLAEAFAASLADLMPVAERRGNYVHAPVVARTYISDRALPVALVRSARALVLRRRAVVVVRERDGYRHITPGGRLEPGETVEEAVRREVLEECGWRLGALRPLGLEHVQHVDAPPPGFPAAGFLNPIFVAEGLSFHRSARDMTQSEVGSSLVSVARALRELPDWSATLLRSAHMR